MGPLIYVLDPAGWASELHDFMWEDIDRKIQLALALRLSRDLWNAVSYAEQETFRQAVLEP